MLSRLSSGNYLVDAQDAIECKVCKICEEENGHSCTYCGTEISEECCTVYHGLCIRCEEG